VSYTLLVFRNTHAEAGSICEGHARIVTTKNKFMLDMGYVTVTSQHKKGLRAKTRNPLFLLVGVVGFEPTTPCSQRKCAKVTPRISQVGVIGILSSFPIYSDPF